MDYVSRGGGNREAKLPYLNANEDNKKLLIKFSPLYILASTNINNKQITYKSVNQNL